MKLLAHFSRSERPRRACGYVIRILVGNVPHDYPYRSQDSAPPPHHSLTQPFYHHHSSFPGHHISSMSDMSQPSSIPFQDLFNAALLDYESQTGTRLANHPLAKQLEACDSVHSITAILQKQAQIFHEFRGDDGRLMRSLKSSVDVLYTLSISTVLGGGVGLVHPNSFIGFPRS